MLSFVAVIEAAFAAKDVEFTRFYIRDWRVSGAASMTEASGCRYLCFGDSLMKFGVIPNVFKDRLGGETYNLAVCDGQASSSYFLLRRALEAESVPRAVVVDFVPHLLATDPRHNLRQWPELLDGKEAVELSLATRHAGFTAALALGMLLPSVRDRYEIRTEIVAAFKGQLKSRRDEIQGYLRQWARDRGAQITAKRPTYRGDAELTNPAYFPKKWSCHSTNLAFVEKFLDLAASRGAEVFWLLPPVTPRFQARRDELGLEAKYSEFARILQERHENLTIIDARHAGFDHSLFIDQLHLDEEGARSLSELVASAMLQSLSPQERERPTRARWMELSRRAESRADRPMVTFRAAREGGLR
jgi:hypothetical protein